MKNWHIYHCHVSPSGIFRIWLVTLFLYIMAYITFTQCSASRVALAFNGPIDHSSSFSLLHLLVEIHWRVLSSRRALGNNKGICLYPWIWMAVWPGTHSYSLKTHSALLLHLLMLNAIMERLEAGQILFPFTSDFVYLQCFP